MTDYAAKLADLRTAAAIRADVARGKVLLGRYGRWIRRYHGGMPVGILAANMHYESDGNETAVGDVSLGEYGLYQVTKYFPPSVGLPAESRKDPETNVFLGCLEYQTDAATMRKIYGSRVPLGSVDQWKLSRLVFSIGQHGTTDLVNKALAAGSSGWGLYDKVRSYVDSTGGTSYGSQSAQKVWFRVHFVDHVFDVGQQIERGSFGPPMIIPAPPGVVYKFPPSLLPFTAKSMGGTLGGLFLAAGAAAVAYYLARHA